ncbi:hypothetical protein ABEB36_009985 [Hypothenemus hampei]|uniref:Trehalase n=1 Tax=Hypothenemus hampei TaxID=57062 RepID=A0ABD1EIS5_HYPHA
MHCCHTMQTVFLISLLVVLSSCNPIWQQKTLKDIQSCSSPVYCQGPLLDTVQRAQIFNDSKTFVDMSQVNSVNITLENFWKLMNATDGTPTRQDIIEFVNANFLSQNETVPWTPPDFNENPSLINKIQDQNVREFTQNLIKIWPTLGRKISPDVYQNPDQHSILEVPNGFVVPGGRFKELYYWDSLWIVKGLLISEMYDTVKGMLENMCYLINQIGFMPNGSRNYFLNRSQPPALTLMIQEYLKYTKNTAWVNEIVGCVESELTFWLENHTKLVEKDGEVYELAHFESESNTPRPESYDKDLKTCSSYSEETEKKLCYKSLKSGAETGWDFSTRWFFDDNGGTDTNLTHIRPQRVVPVDLNAFLCKAFADLAEFYAISGEPHKEALWQERSNIWQKSIEMVRNGNG